MTRTMEEGPRAGGLRRKRLMSTPRLGDEAVPFSLLDTEGRRHELTDYRGQWLLLVFHRHLG